MKLSSFTTSRLKYDGRLLANLFGFGSESVTTYTSEFPIIHFSNFHTFLFRRVRGESVLYESLRNVRDMDHLIHRIYQTG